METEKLQSVNLAEEDELFLNFSAAQVNDRIYKSFDFNFVSFSFFQHTAHKIMEIGQLAV